MKDLLSVILFLLFIVITVKTFLGPKVTFYFLIVILVSQLVLNSRHIVEMTNLLKG